jgi:hypothetical protein
MEQDLVVVRQTPGEPDALALQELTLAASARVMPDVGEVHRPGERRAVVDDMRPDVFSACRWPWTVSRLRPAARESQFLSGCSTSL